jgi:hypothetical protein
MALDRLDHLRLERQFVLTMRDGAHFDFDSAMLTAEARRQIDRFVADLKGVADVHLVIAGHTDNVGPAEYNYELGQRRASGVARYLIARQGFDPLRVVAVSYGASAPLADNRTREGRRKNRRIEILVYREALTSSPGGQRLDIERSGNLGPGLAPRPTAGLADPFNLIDVGRAPAAFVRLARSLPEWRLVHRGGPRRAMHAA